MPKTKYKIEQADAEHLRGQLQLVISSFKALTLAQYQRHEARRSICGPP